jgi:hypothetical protein
MSTSRHEPPPSMDLARSDDEGMTRRKTLAMLSGGLMVAAGCGGSTSSSPAEAATPPAVSPGPTPAPAPSAGAPSPPAAGTGGAAYDPGFRLRPLAADPIPRVARPARRSAGLDSPSWIDPVYGTRVYMVTDPADYPGASFIRHDYSRRQAFNANNTRFIAETSSGWWLLYDANTFRPIRGGGQSGSMQGMAGDCEAFWHPTDPRLLWFTDNTGGLVWMEKNVETDFNSRLADFRGRLPWPGATSVWTKSEGSPSADGRTFAFMATSYDSVSKTVTCHGLFTWDRVADRILGTLPASAFGNATPDHISISASGRHVVPSWAFTPNLGTRAYPLDFSSSIQLHSESEHSDLAIGPNGEDLYVATNYKDGVVWAKNLATGASFNLMSLYPRQGAAIGAAHFSAQCFNRPGWVVMSTYADSASQGAVTPDPVLEPPHRKIMLLELKPNGRQYNIAHTRAAANYGGYFGEHHATVSRDGTRILFATNFDDGGPPACCMVVLPAQVYS